jgi:serine/threonine protein kinase
VTESALKPVDDQADAGAEAPPADGWLDRVLDQRYRILRLLGEGGMGAVFVAEHLALHKLVALKIVRAELKADAAEVAIRLAREAMATARLEHPHVASAIDYGSLPEGGAYFVMQLVRGTSLRRLIAGGRRMPWTRACEIAAQVADALSATRSAGITHRDLKPDNILIEVREDGSDLVKVLDFGIAQVAPRTSGATPGAEPNRQITLSGTVMGTPGYMSPEQAVGDRVDHRADLYALGVVLWECIAGRELWVGPDLTSLVARQMSESVPPLTQMQIDETLPAELDELIGQLTERMPSARPDNAAQVRDALRRMLRPRSVTLASSAANLQQQADRPARPRRRKRRARQTRRSFWIAGAAALLCYFGFREVVPLLRDQASASSPDVAQVEPPRRIIADVTPSLPMPVQEFPASFDVSAEEIPPQSIELTHEPAPPPVRRAPAAAKPPPEPKVPSAAFEPTDAQVDSLIADLARYGLEEPGLTVAQPRSEPVLLSAEAAAP